MSDKLRVGILGGTGMVGQRFITLLENHPWFEVVLVAASGRSAGKLYEDAVEGRWKMQTPMPEFVKKMTVYDMDKDFDEIVSKVDFVFCAVNMPKDQIKAIEERYAKAEVPVVSNNSANRFTPDVPMIIPEINDEHLKIIEAQRKRLGTKKGFIAVKSNCSLQSYVPAIHPLLKYGVKKVLACTYQAISGAGKTFESFPEILDNVIPYIGGEEEKSEKEPLRLWGKVEDGVITDGAFVGDGCAISQASADIMLDLIIGEKKEGALHLAELFLKMIKDSITEEEMEELDEAAALQDVAHMPARVKCAVLGWHTMEEMFDLDKQQGAKQ